MGHLFLSVLSLIHGLTFVIIREMSCQIWQIINPLAPERCSNNNKSVNFKLIAQNSNLVTHCEIALRWMSQNFTHKKSTLVQAMAWCRQATSHYLSPCWPWSISPHGVTRRQWVNATCVQYYPSDEQQILCWHRVILKIHMSWILKPDTVLS